MDDSDVWNKNDSNISAIKKKSCSQKVCDYFMEEAITEEKNFYLVQEGVRPQELFSLKNDNILVLVQLLNNLISKS